MSRHHDQDIPQCSWSISLNEAPPSPGKPRRYPILTMLKMLPIIFRLRKLKKIGGKGAEPPAEFRLQPIDDGYNQGIPIGGLGAGSIGRSYKGDFTRWHLQIGRHLYHPSIPNQFHLRIERSDEVFARTLNARNDVSDRLETWAWGMDPARAKYYALFPRAWTVYDFHDKGLMLSCKQLSPVIAHNYEESSFPVGVFVWSLTNVSESALDVSLMLTWENAIDPFRLRHPNDYTRSEKREEGTLIELAHARTEDVYPVSFGIGCSTKTGRVSFCEKFNTDGHGGEVWFPFRRTGELENNSEQDFNGRIGSALCAKIEVPPDESRKVAFSIAWDIPIMRFGKGREWYRRYTRFFDTSGDNATKIAALGLRRWQEWEEKIVRWQKPILDADWPDWLKCALFNELYYLVDGGTAWETGDVDSGLQREGIGRFAYLECFDYPFYNTYDVHFYASFALLRNWPQLDNSIQRTFAETVTQEDNRLRMLLFEGGKAPRKPYGVIPHDLGMPEEDPWFMTNAYNAQDVGRWKDLNTKFVLQVYRNYVHTNDDQFLEDCWPSVKVAMEYIDKFDRDEDGLIENDGFPDQTYDIWTMKGPSAYCAGLYLAAVSAMVAMAQRMDDEAVAEKYKKILERGKRAFEEKLWNGEYFNFDASERKHSSNIMADMLAGLLYANVSNLEPYVDREKARKSLQKIFQMNVMGLANGTMGAMNGMRPDGKIDRTSIQSAEVWTGTTYALAALMLHEGFIEEGLKTAEGVYRVTYQEKGYWFRTPEAWTKDGMFRATMYMRPLAIWALETVLNKSGVAKKLQN